MFRGLFFTLETPPKSYLVVVPVRVVGVPEERGGGDRLVPPSVVHFLFLLARP